MKRSADRRARHCRRERGVSVPLALAYRGGMARRKIGKGKARKRRRRLLKQAGRLLARFVFEVVVIVVAAGILHALHL